MWNLPNQKTNSLCSASLSLTQLQFYCATSVYATPIPATPLPERIWNSHGPHPWSQTALVQHSFTSNHHFGLLLGQTNSSRKAPVCYLHFKMQLASHHPSSSTKYHQVANAATTTMWGYFHFGFQKDFILKQLVHCEAKKFE